jgi:hypothetical protein
MMKIFYGMHLRKKEEVKRTGWRVKDINFRGKDKQTVIK